MKFRLAPRQNFILAPQEPWKLGGESFIQVVADGKKIKLTSFDDTDGEAFEIAGHPQKELIVELFVKQGEPLNDYVPDLWVAAGPRWDGLVPEETKGLIHLQLSEDVATCGEGKIFDLSKAGQWNYYWRSPANENMHLRYNLIKLFYK